MGKEDVAAKEDVGAAGGETLDAIDERRVEPLIAKLIDELVIVDLASFFGQNFPWIHYLFFSDHHRRRKRKREESRGLRRRKRKREGEEWHDTQESGREKKKY